MWLLRCACTVIILLTLVAAAYVDVHTNPMGRTLTYRRARLSNWLAAGFVYVVFYQARYAATISNTHETRELMGIQPAEYGTILSAGFWSYAVGTLVNGFILDRIGGRVGMLVGSTGCAVTCGCLSLIMQRPRPSHTALLVLNTLNMGIASLAALSVLRINVAWYSKVERGVFSGVFGVMISVGYFLALTVGSWIAADLPRGFAFSMPSALLLVVCIPLCLFVIRDTPPTEEAQITLTEPTPPIEAVAAPDEQTSTQDDDASHARSAAASPRFVEAACAVLAHARVRAAILGLMGVGWAREGFLSWFASYVSVTCGIEMGTTRFTLMTTAMSLNGVVGSLLGGYFSDRFLRSKRGPVVLVYGACQLVCLLGLHFAQGDANATFVIIALLATFLFGALTLLMGAASADFVEPRYAGMASGIFNTGQYVAAGLGAMVTGSAVGVLGWSAFPAIVAVGPVLSCVGTSLLIWHQKSE